MEIKPIAPNRRILIVDDSAAIHDDFRKILVRSHQGESDFEKAEASLFGSPESGSEPGQGFELTSAYQGEDAMIAVCEAVKAGQPFVMAFVDIRMPPGLDGIETTEQLWKADPDLQIILCTAYSDYSWKDVHARLGATDRMVILKKPFDAMEVLQLASALAEKWMLLQQSKLKVRDLEQVISERTKALQSSNEQLRAEVRQRQAAEQESRGAQQKLKHFLSHNPAVLYSLKFKNLSLVPSWVSDNFSTFTGHDLQQWYSQTPALAYVEEADRPAVIASLPALLTQNRVSLQFRLRRQDGVIRWVRDDRQLLRDKSGQPVEIVGCWTDITERRHLEEHLRQSQKMEAFGQLAGGVAHDFNNLLTIIQGYVSLLQEDDHSPEDRADGLATIAKAADRAANLTRQLLTFTRRQLFQTRPLDLNEVIAGTREMLQKLVGESIALKTTYMPDKAGISADQHMLEQTLINLAANARDAMPKGGQLILSTSRCDIPDEPPEARRESRPGPHICLTVTDTGCGIAPENLPRIFEPFYTTKEVGKGTGLGLASVYGIIKQHEGWIEVSSRVGEGTTFKIYFPASESPAEPAKASSRTQAARGDGERILVVEDEPGLRELFQITLERLGYQVFTESSGAAALRAWSSRLDQIDLLLTDIIMPDGVSGWDLASSLQAEKPSLQAIYMSGYNTEARNGNKSVRLLPKPFDTEKLAEMVRNSLDEVKTKSFPKHTSRIPTPEPA
jgi:two-component system, cell cycle sensor histidine kinase and response regulator CckA